MEISIRSGIGDLPGTEALKILASQASVLFGLIILCIFLVAFRKSLAARLRSGGLSVSCIGIEIKLPQVEVDGVVTRLLLDAQCTIRPEDFEAFNLVQKREGKKTEQIFPGFARRTLQHDCLSRLRSAYLIRSPDGGRIRPERRLVLTRLGRVLLKHPDVERWFDGGGGVVDVLPEAEGNDRGV